MPNTYTSSGSAAVSNLYCTLAELKFRLTQTDADTTDNSALTDVITAVSRAIDKQCDRFFYFTAAATRYYSAEWTDWLLPDDIVSITTLKTDDDGDRTFETTWATTDYDLEPYNAAAHSEPYTSIRVAPNGTQRFSRVRRGVELVGVFGWPAVPDAVREACILQSMRLWKRKDSVYGVVGSAEMGQMLVIPKLDPDVKLLLDSFKRHV